MFVYFRGYIFNFISIVLIVAGFLAFCILLMNVMFAFTNVEDLDSILLSRDKIEKKENIKTPNYKNIAKEIGTEADLREYERQQREELERLNGK